VLIRVLRGEKKVFCLITTAISRILNESDFGVRLGLGLSAVGSGAGLNSAVGTILFKKPQLKPG
jgi:hypothetical protein